MGNSMLEVEPTGQSGSVITGSGRNGLELRDLRCRYLHNEDTLLATSTHFC